MALNIESKNFAEVINSDKPVLVDFWAAWCGPCRVIGPTIEELANEYEGKAIVGKVDVDAQPELAMKFNVRSIPTLLFFKDGKVVERQVGVSSKSELAGKLEDLLTEQVA